MVARIETLESNLNPSDPVGSREFWSHLFVSIGVFFPSSIGVMAGVNMGADLHTPTRSIPIGSLTAIFSSYITHLLFIFGLGSMCVRNALLNDFAVSQHVAASGGLFLQLGLYMSALSSSLGSMYTAPRILQNIAQELHSVPFVKYLSRGIGPNKSLFFAFLNFFSSLFIDFSSSFSFFFYGSCSSPLGPIFGLILFSVVTMAFVMVGGINVLAPIVTIPYLLTYSAIEYAYFSMAMTFDIQIAREKRFMAIANDLRNDVSSPDIAGGTGNMVISNTTLARSTDSGLPGDIEVTETTSLKEDKEDRDDPKSPTPSIQHLNGYGSVQSVTAHIKIKRRQSTQSDSSGEDDEAGTFGSFRSSMKKLETQKKHRTQNPESQSLCEESLKRVEAERKKSKKTKTIRQLMAAESDDDEEEDDDSGEQDVHNHAHMSKNSVFRFETHNMTTNPQQHSSHDLSRTYTNNIINERNNSDDDENVEENLLKPDPEIGEIGCKSEAWYLRLMNRWTVMAAAAAKFTLMFAIAWHYAVVTMIVFCIFYLFIGKTNPGHYPGVSEFSLWNTIRSFLNRIRDG